MAHSRREFIKNGITFVGAGMMAPHLLAGSSGIARAQGPGGNRILIVVEFNGGNDGLNTIVPFTQPNYYQYRPRLGLRENQVIPLTDTLGLHPSLGALKGLYDEQRVAIVQGVGYPNPDRSHFRSTEIWQSSRPETIEPTGWLGRYLDTISPPGSLALDGISVGFETPLTLTTGVASTVASIDSLDTYVFMGDEQRPEDEAVKRATFAGLYDDARGEGTTLDFVANTGLSAYSSSQTLAEVGNAYVPAVPYQGDPFSQDMLLVAQLISAGLGTNVFYTSLGSFDTHASQANDHAVLLRWFSDGVASFYRDMVAHGWGDQVLVMSFSEFGRRVNENESAGTDHGTAAPQFILGNAVKGGIYGDHPSLRLEDLDFNYDLVHGIDFRAIYSTVLAHWFDTDPASILGTSFEDLGFL